MEMERTGNLFPGLEISELDGELTKPRRGAFWDGTVSCNAVGWPWKAERELAQREKSRDVSEDDEMVEVGVDVGKQLFTSADHPFTRGLATERSAVRVNTITSADKVVGSGKAKRGNKLTRPGEARTKGGAAPANKKSKIEGPTQGEEASKLVVSKLAKVESLGDLPPLLETSEWAGDYLMLSDTEPLGEVRVASPGWRFPMPADQIPKWSTKRMVKQLMLEFDIDKGSRNLVNKLFTIRVSKSRSSTGNYVGGFLGRHSIMSRGRVRRGWVGCFGGIPPGAPGVKHESLGLKKLEIDRATSSSTPTGKQNGGAITSRASNSQIVPS
jgi:hypothetical protein